MVDYRFYTDAYIGEAIPEKAFSGMALQAETILQKFKRVYRVESPGPDSEKMAVCAMADVLYQAKKNASGITGATVGNMSVRYDSKYTGRKALMTEIYEQASIYLDIYRGVAK